MPAIAHANGSATALATPAAPSNRIRRTEAQRAASRQNGTKSHGPVTPEGKIASRRNALKDGFSPAAATILPTDMQREVDGLLDALTREFQPSTPQELALVQTAALAGARAQRLMSAEHRHVQNRVRRSVLDWDNQRATLVDSLADRLESEPRMAVRQLRSIAEGCDYLADAWDALADALQDRANWDGDQRRLALRLLGSSDEPDADRPRSAPTAGPRSAVSVLLDLVRAIDSGSTEAVDGLRAFAESQRDSLVRRGDELWEKIDAPERAEAPLRAPFDPSPEYARLARYMGNAERAQERALAQLRQIRAEHASAAQARRESALERMAAYQHARETNTHVAPNAAQKPPRQNEPSATQPPTSSTPCDPRPAQAKTSAAFSHLQTSQTEPSVPSGPDASR